MTDNIQKAKKGVKWFSLFSGVSQAFSFVTTILIARILMPSDYGLIEMAGVLVGYVVLFGDLGVGSAVVQRKNNSQKELSSLFWFTFFWGMVLCILGILLAYPTAWIFDNPRVIWLTQVSSIIFVAGGLGIVPRNILERNYSFVALGLAEGGAVIASCCLMLLMAKLGYGVWSLIIGQVVREYIKLIVYCINAKWLPSFFFRRRKILPYLKFGLNVALSNSLYYLHSKSDRFFVGKYLGAQVLGGYSFALQLAMIPSDKIVYFINRFSFPVFSRQQSSLDEVGRIYLKLLRFLSFLIFPMYVGGIFLANDLIIILLGEKWRVIILPFQVLCASQIVLSATSVNKFVLNALGRPVINVYFALFSVLVFVVAFYLCAQKGILYILLPWVTVIPLISIINSLVVIRILNIRVLTLLQSFYPAIAGSIVMLTFLAIYQYVFGGSVFGEREILEIGFKVGIGVLSYGCYCFLFNRDMIDFIKSFR